MLNKLKLCSALSFSVCVLFFELFVRENSNFEDYSSKKYLFAKLGIYGCAVVGLLVNFYVKKTGQPDVFSKERLENISWRSAEKNLKFVIFLLFIFSISFGIAGGSLFSLIADR